MSLTLHPESYAPEEIEFISKGQITIPKHLREDYNIHPGLKGTIIPIPGAMILVPGQPKTPDLFQKIAEGLGTEEMSLEEMLVEMQQIRKSNDFEA